MCEPTLSTAGRFGSCAVPWRVLADFTPRPGSCYDACIQLGIHFCASAICYSLDLSTLFTHIRLVLTQRNFVSDPLPPVVEYRFPTPWIIDDRSVGLASLTRIFSPNSVLYPNLLPVTTLSHSQIIAFSFIPRFALRLIVTLLIGT